MFVISNQYIDDKVSKKFPDFAESESNVSRRCLIEVKFQYLEMLDSEEPIMG
jgi:hypothetical protein